jgi:hypothetical protein
VRAKSQFVVGRLAPRSRDTSEVRFGVRILLFQNARTARNYLRHLFATSKARKRSCFKTLLFQNTKTGVKKEVKKGGRKMDFETRAIFMTLFFNNFHSRFKKRLDGTPY